MWTDASSTVGAYAAGFLEGYLTQDLTWAFRHNFFSGNSLNTTYSAAGSSATDKAAAFLEANFAWVQSQIAAHAAIDNSAYWQQINLEYTQVWPCDVFVVALVVCRITADVAFGGLVWCSWLQLAGMVAGYNSAAPAGQELTHTDFLFMNSQVRRFMLLLRGAIRWGSHTPPHAPLLTRLVWSMSRRAILATFNKPCCLTACETTRLTCRLLMYAPRMGCCGSKGGTRAWLSHG